METRGRDDDPDQVIRHFDVENDGFRLYPAILFTFLRLREWEGLPNPPVLEHDLFRKGALKELPQQVAIPQDAFYSRIEQQFRAEMPDTPTLADLGALRAAQG